MGNLRSIWRGVRLVCFVLAGWLALHATALAQAQQQKKEEPAGGGYVLSYMLVILCIGLGMLFVCRSSHRRERARPENYEEAKAV